MCKCLKPIATAAEPTMYPDIQCGLSDMEALRRALQESTAEVHAPLPSFWSIQNKSKNITLSQNSLKVDNTNGYHISAVQSNMPIPASCNQFYYEITILPALRAGVFWSLYIGLTRRGSSAPRVLGSATISFGYNESGWKRHWEESRRGYGKWQSYGPSFDENDVIGCGLLGNNLFYTKNGQFLGVAFRDVPSDLYPALSLVYECAAVANFGQTAFRFRLNWDELRTLCTDRETQ